MTANVLSVEALQRRYDAAVISTNGLDLPARIVESAHRRLVVDASMDRFVRPGGTIPGPAQVTLIDGLAWLLLVTNMPDGADAFTTDLSVQFMRAVPLGEVRASLTVERLGRNRAVVSALIELSDEPRRPISSLTLGFALRGNASSP